MIPADLKSWISTIYLFHNLIWNSLSWIFCINTINKNKQQYTKHFFPWFSFFKSVWISFFPIIVLYPLGGVTLWSCCWVITGCWCAFLWSRTRAPFWGCWANEGLLWRGWRWWPCPGPPGSVHSKVSSHKVKTRLYFFILFDLFWFLFQVLQLCCCVLRPL